MHTRRHVLELAALAASGLVLGCGAVIDPAEVPESTTRFPRTPMAGDMTSTRVVFTFHVADDSAVTLRVWTDDDELVVDQAVGPSGDGFHKVVVDALSPGTRYHYAVFGGEAPEFTDRSLIGTVKTAPRDDVLGTVRVALVSCVGQGTILPDFYMPSNSTLPTPEPFQWAIFEQAAGLDLDAIVHLGDQAYLDYVWSLQDGTLEAYLHAWGYYHGGGYRDLYPVAGLYATWDDHEATDNANFDPWDITAEERAKLTNAHTAWYKVIPIAADTPADGTVWRSFRWGQTLELILLDCRYELGPDRLMSPAQLDWLLARIEASTARFVCVATPKPFAAITSSEPLLADNADRWDGYLRDRQRVVEVLDDLGARNVIFVTGDIHMNYLGRASVSGEAPSDQVWEVCCSAGNTSPMADSLSPEQFVFVAREPQLPVLTFDGQKGTVHVAFHAADGSLTYERELADV